jgi:hypothetical protein
VEGRVRIVCAECGREREVSGEIPDEYTACFEKIVQEDGFVPRPGNALAFLCGACLKNYEGSESADDEAKIRS